MSDTDKTKPNWVKVKQNINTKAVREYHDHRRHDCDLHEADAQYIFYWQRRGSCGYDVSYYGWHNGFYARPPHGKEYRRIFEGQARAEWRKTSHELRKLSREDIKDYDVAGYRHRHSALWEMY
jgi:hypothetical protein